MNIVGLSNFPTSLFLLAIILAPVIYGSYHIVVPWMIRVCDEKADYLHFFMFHLIIFLLFATYLNLGGFLVDLNANLSLITYLELAVLMQIGIYCIFSVGASLRIALYFIFSDKEEYEELDEQR